MPGLPHEVPVQLVHEEPALLGQLLDALGVGRLPAGLKVVDSNLRLADPVELRPDLALVADNGDWALVELQLEPDHAKRWRWPLMVAVMLDQHRVMGELIVITPHRRVARWARRATELASRLGTALTVEPVVVHLSGQNLHALLSAEQPELAFFAAWAMHHRKGARARRIVRRALDLVGTLPRERQGPLTRAILNVLSEPMLAYLREVEMNPDRIPESDAVRAWRLELEARAEQRGEERGETRGEERGERRGEVRALARTIVAVLERRNMAVESHHREQIAQCDDPDTLQQWFDRAFTAQNVDEVFRG